MGWGYVKISPTLKEVIMRKLFFILALALVCGAVVGLRADNKEYSPASTPNALYFVSHQYMPYGTTLTITNKETYMWACSALRFNIQPEKAFTNTFTFNIVSVIENESGVTSRVFTNNFGNVETNYLHGITNTTYTYLTNTIYSGVTTNTTNHVILLDKVYIQKGDILQFSWTDSTNKWLTIDAWR